MRTSQVHLVLAAATSTAALSIAGVARAQVPVIDGTRDPSYGPPASIQTVNTGFGDNQSELDAVYGHIVNGKLSVMLTGNLESNFNKLVIFADTRPGGQNVMRGDNPDVDFNNLNTRYVGMTFDSGFAPDYVMFWSRDPANVFLNFSELNTNGGGLGGFLGAVPTPNPNQQGMGTVGGADGLPLVEFGYNDANTGGVIAGSDAANPSAAAAVTTGSEFSIDLPAIGATESFSVMIGINGSNHDFWSNQFLPGLQPPQGNLGSDGMGNFIPPGSVSLVNFNNINGEQFQSISYHAPLSQWNNPGSGNWNNTFNWSGDGVPNAPDARAVLGALAGNAPRTLTLDVPVRLASLTFDSTGSYTIDGPNALTIAGNPATPAVLVRAGSHTIAAPLVLGATTNFTITPAASTLSLTGPLTATGQAIVKAGAGKLSVTSIRARALTVLEGEVEVRDSSPPPGGDAAGDGNVSQVTTLFIANGPLDPVARLDLSDNGLIASNIPDTVGGGRGGGGGPDAGALENARNYLNNGYAGGGWTGNGITSGTAVDRPGAGIHAVGYAEASSVGITVFGGLGVLPTDILFKFTRHGDADLSGQVNLNDFNRLAANFGGTNKVWSEGDFNYDGNVNLSDFNLLAANFGLSAGGDGVVDPADWAALAAAVPEPGAAGALLSGCTLLARRRQRKPSGQDYT